MVKPLALFLSWMTLCIVVWGTPLYAQDTLPSGWSAADVGDVGQPGHATESGGQFTITGAGADIWSTSDAFQFAYRQLSGATDIEAIFVRLRSQTATESFAKAGVMIRQALDPSAPHVVLDVRPTGEVEFM